MMIEYHLNEHEWGRIEREKGKHVHYYSRHHVLLGESSLGWSFAVATLSLVFFTLHLSARPSLFFLFLYSQTLPHFHFTSFTALSLSLCVLRKCAVPAIETGRRQLGIFYDRFAKKITSNVTLSSKLNCFFFSLFPCTKCLSILIWRSIEWLSAFRRRVVRNESVIFFFLFLVV